MNDFQDIKRLVMPLIRGSWFIVLSVILALVIAYKAMFYIVPQFQSVAKLKLDDSKMGIGNNILYKDFDLFPTTNKILTEVEVLTSNTLIEKAVSKLDYKVSYYRIGEILTTEMYHDSPFNVDLKIKNPNIQDKPINFKVIDLNNYTVTYNLKGIDYSYLGNFGKAVSTPDLNFTLHLNKKIELAQLKDPFFFKINSTEALVNHIKSNLDIKSVEKDVPVVRISYMHPVPVKSADVVNTLAKTYIEDYVDGRTETAKKTVSFIDEQLTDIGQKLKVAENNLKDFRQNNKIVNLKQETETGLKKMSELKVQLANLRMNEAAVNQLNDYVKKGNFTVSAPQVGFGDLLFTELVKKLKSYEVERKTLLQKYQPDNPKILALNESINNTTLYLKESIINAKKDISTKRASIEQTIAVADHEFDDLPYKEKELLVLEREFLMAQKTFNFLTEKRTEAAIASAGAISFHRILKEAQTPTNPTIPQRRLIYFVSGLLAVIISITLIYLRHFMINKIENRDDIERNSGIPVIGTLPKSNDEWTVMERASMIGGKLAMVGGLDKNQSIAITSALRGEGKTFIACHLASAMAEAGWKVALIDCNWRNPELHTYFDRNNKIGISDFISGWSNITEIIQKTKHHNLFFVSAGTRINAPGTLFARRDLGEQIQDLKSQFDLIIFDTPASTMALDAVSIMKHCEHNLFVAKTNSTKVSHILNADFIQEAYGIENLHLLLNCTKANSNYEGYFSGKQYQYQRGGVWSKIKELFKRKPKTNIPTEQKLADAF